MPLFVASWRNCLRDLVELLEGLRGVDDELHRQAVAAGQRRRLEGDDLRAGDAADLLLDDRLELVGGRARWSQGFRTMPAMDWPGTSSWKTWSISEWRAKMS